MKKKQYRQVSKLPAGAKTVKAYADQYPSRKGVGVNPSYLYKLVNEGKDDDFEIIQFAGINFIIPRATRP